MFDKSKFVRLGYQKSAFRHYYGVSRDIASKEKFAADGASISLKFRTLVYC